MQIDSRTAPLRRGFVLEYLTLGWNVAGVVILALTAIAARSVALAGFGLDSLIEIGASVVVVWELSGTGQARQRRALALIGAAFGLLAIYLAVQSSWVLAAGDRPRHSMAGIGWTAATAAVMYALAAGKARTGAALSNPVLCTEGRVTMVNAVLATAVLTGLVLNAALGWWWADPAASYVLVFYAAREVREHRPRPPPGRRPRRATEPGHATGLLIQPGRIAGPAERQGARPPRAISFHRKTSVHLIAAPAEHPIMVGGVSVRRGGLPGCQRGPAWWLWP